MNWQIINLLISLTLILFSGLAAIVLIRIKKAPGL